MAIKEAMAPLADKPASALTYEEVSDTYIYYIRLDFDPVGIKYCTDEPEIPKYRINAKAKARLTFCQFLALARGGHKAMFLTPDKLLCENAEVVFGFREPNQEKDTKGHLKYLMREELAWGAVVKKAKLAPGACKGIYTAPLSLFDQAGVDPDIVFFMALPYQVYHILNDYMGATGQSELNFKHTVNSAVCTGSVWALKHNTANMTTMCAGSKTSGKTDMSMLNLFIPGSQIKASAAQLLRRVAAMGGPSVLGKGGEPWPGLDVCKACPLFKYEEI
jgi:uncharacterized protein (DUF169 family)